MDTNVVVKQFKHPEREQNYDKWNKIWTYQLILKEINPEYSLKELMLKLKFQYFGHLMQRADSLEKTLMLGKIEAEGEEGNRG